MGLWIKNHVTKVISDIIVMHDLIADAVFVGFVTVNRSENKRNNLEVLYK